LKKDDETLPLQSKKNLNKSLHECPNEPIFAAIRETHGKKFDFSKYHFITDRNNLKKLFNLCIGSDYARFRIDFERIKNTIIIDRFDLDESEEEIKAAETGFTFEDKCCKGDASQSFRALLEFEKAGLKFLMRCEVDSMKKSENDKKPMDKEIDEITEQISKLSHDEEIVTDLIIEKNNDPNTPTHSSQFIELTTKKFYNVNFMRTNWFQSFIAGTPEIIIGIRQEQSVIEIMNKKTRDMERELDKDELNAAINRVVELLKTIKQKLEDGEKASLIWEPFDNSNKGSFRFYRHKDDPSSLPPYIRNWILSEKN